MHLKSPLPPIAILSAIGMCAFLLIGCAPVAPIQSARILHTFSFASSVSYSPTTYQLDDSVHSFSYRPFDIDDVGNSGFLQPFPSPSAGIRRRVALSAYLLPFIAEYNFGGASLKICFFDAGEQRLFRNMALSGFGEGILMWGEWMQHTVARTGFIAGTHAPLRNGEIELVFRSLYNWEMTYASNSDYPGISLNERRIDLSPGVLWWPGQDKTFEIATGFTVLIPLETEVSTRSTGTIKSDFFPVVFHAGLTCNLIMPDPAASRRRKQ